MTTDARFIILLVVDSMEIQYISDIPHEEVGKVIGDLRSVADRLESKKGKN